MSVILHGISTNLVQFAAEAANVDLCAYLISEGADKRALAYEGPTADTLYVLMCPRRKVFPGCL